MIPYDRPAVPELYRENISAADIVDRSGLSTSTAVATTGGSLAANTYKVALVPRGAAGRGLAVSLTNVVVGGANNAILITPSESVDFDVYVSTDASPLWVATVLAEEWSDTGVKVTAVGTTTTTGATAGKIKVQVVGTGFAASANNAEVTDFLVPPTEGVPNGFPLFINTSNFQYVDFLLDFQYSGETEEPGLVVIPFLKSEVPLSDGTREDRWYAEDQHEIEVNGGREADSFMPGKSRLRIQTRGAIAVALVVASISGQGATLDIHQILT